MTAPMVVKEFIKRRVAPLQRHSRLMWTLLSSQDHMRFKESGLPLGTRQTVLKVLTGVSSLDDLPRKNCLLYRRKNKAEFTRSMPPFDEWGLRPDGLVGSHENPVSAVPLFVAGAELVPNVGAGGRAPLEAGGTSADVRTPPGAPGASSSGSHDSGTSVAETM